MLSREKKNEKTGRCCYHEKMDKKEKSRMSAAFVLSVPVGYFSMNLDYFDLFVV